MNGALMVCGTTSDAGKSHVVTGLCRLLARKGVKVAPFKAQNMSLNSYVTPSGHEIGRAQGVQALAAGAEPERAMNPILLKPTGDRACQVVVLGRPVGHLTPAEYHERTTDLLATVVDSLADLRRRFDVVICEGAGSPAEINLLDRDIVNLRVAVEAGGIPAIIVGDIDRGGVFAALHGTVDLLPSAQRRLVKGFVINKLRGDPALLYDGCAQLESRTGVPTLGVLPYVADVALDAEDSLALRGPRPRPLGDSPGDHIDIAAIRFPCVSNATDLDALSIEPGVAVRLVEHPSALGHPDLIVLPGTKATVADLAWLRRTGFDRAVRDAGCAVLGICGGYQMLGRRILDPDGIETGVEGSDVEGLGHLDVVTTFTAEKITRQHPGGRYEIHHGVVQGVDDEGGLTTDRMGRFLGTSLHGLFEDDAFRAEFLADIARNRRKTFVPTGVSFAAARDAQFDRLADLLEAHLDVDRLLTIIENQ